ncbi:hypothetical protein HNQ59_000071 [Chitinivorax tropicus]|uniref:Uncharacterized protein n=1 Tax=Chitinivorax tropicus TaxID=714531 RepID=A0A840MHZ0_9PROT|nr:hypothetical protein [Chitinivorax tropicus]MBB5016809.1 hypothetical protein [Chitinivorax tropicus]
MLFWFMTTASCLAADITDTAADFRAMRQRHGHFDGGPWQPALDQWQGKKHQAMQKLARHVWQQRLGTAQVRQLMGEPDELIRPDMPMYSAQIQHSNWQGQPAGELWLYNWRGKHDRLVLAMGQGRVVATGWQNAWE